jgi:hypothetical protein
MRNISFVALVVPVLACRPSAIESGQDALALQPQLEVEGPSSTVAGTCTPYVTRVIDPPRIGDMGVVPTVISLSASALGGTNGAFYLAADVLCAGAPIHSVVLPPTQTAVSYSFRDEQSQPVVLSSAAAGFTTGTETVTVTPAVPAQLAFLQQPTDSRVGTPIAPPVQVAIQDAFGNLVPTANAVIDVVDPFHQLQGTTRVSSDGGVASFGDLLLLQATIGYRLTASSADGGLAPGVSSAFDVSLPGPATLSLFGLDKNQLITPLPNPAPGFGLERIWDTAHTSWPWIQQTAKSGFDYTGLDTYLLALHQNGVAEALYTIGNTPGWASCSNQPDGGPQGGALCRAPDGQGRDDLGDGTNCRNYADGGGFESAPGQCYAPFDLHYDGSGANQLWDAFIMNLAGYVNDAGYLQTHAHVRYWEVWNEPDASDTLSTYGHGPDVDAWQGSFAQLIRMAEDARCIIKGDGTIHDYPTAGATPVACGDYCRMNALTCGIDPSALIVMPSCHPEPGADGKFAELAVAQNLLHCTNAPNMSLAAPPLNSACTTGTAGSAVFDAINMHMKISDDVNEGPEYIQTYVQHTRTIMNPDDLAKPFFNDEAGWGDASWPIQDYLYPAIKASFVPRFYFMQWGTLSSVEWFMWEDTDTDTKGAKGGWGLWDPNTQSANLAGQAYSTTYSWLAGAEMTQPCASQQVDYAGTQRTVWTCGFTNAGAAHLAMWDTTPSLVCTASDGGSPDGNCPTAPIPVGPSWVSYQDSFGNTHVIQGGVVPIGRQAIVLN